MTEQKPNTIKATFGPEAAMTQSHDFFGSIDPDKYRFCDECGADTYQRDEHGIPTLIGSEHRCAAEQPID
jgi:hypothetical protein